MSFVEHQPLAIIFLVAACASPGSAVVGPAGPSEPAAPASTAARAELSEPKVLTAPQEIAGGADFSCALRDGGRVACWGNNDLGQLGDGTDLRRAEPVLVKDVAQAVEVAAGAHSACALGGDGRVFCWGRLGAAGAPALVAGITAERISVGHDYACALHAGRVHCWGQEGDDITPSMVPPAPVDGLDEIGALAAGARGGCGRTAEGRVWCWGSLGGKGGEAIAIEGLAEVVEIDVFDEDACVRLAAPSAEGGTVYCWSRYGRELRDPFDDPLVRPLEIHLGNDWGCGREASGFVCWNGGPRALYDDVDQYDPRDFEVVRSPIDEAPVAVGRGAGHLCARTAAGAIVCWGDNRGGQLGVASGMSEPRPRRIPFVAGAQTLVSGQHHLCASDGAQVTCWGDTRDGRLGLGYARSPRVLSELSAPLAMSASHHSCAVVRGGSVACWGPSGWGQIGAGPAPKQAATAGLTGASILGPSQIFVSRVAGLSAVERVATSEEASCALDARGVWCWGRSGMAGVSEPRYGAPCDRLGAFGSLLGEPPEEPAPCEAFQKPRLVPETAGARAIVGLDGGFCVLLRDSIRCWDQAQLAAGLPPRALPKLDRPQAIFGSGGGACAIDTRGELACWTLETMFPRPVVGLAESLGGARVVHVAGGERHHCAVDSAGGVHCWGDDDHGQLARMNKPEKGQSARRVDGISQALAVALGRHHSCALTKDGAVWCWGGPRPLLGGPEPLHESRTPVRVEDLP